MIFRIQNPQVDQASGGVRAVNPQRIDETEPLHLVEHRGDLSGIEDSRAGPR